MHNIKTIKNNNEITSINWHITSNCNYNCKFCYARHDVEEILNEVEIEKILKHCKHIGIKKISFVGGEPLLHKKFPYMLKVSKSLGLITSVITNGIGLLDENKFSEICSYIDWIGISIDSACENIEKELGRGTGTHIKDSLDVIERIKKYGIKLKINSTITKLNFNEDMTEFIKSINPDRWKAFQFLHINEQNDNFSELFAITAKEFEEFINKNKSVEQYEIPVIFENNEVLKKSYFMMLPDGRIVVNNKDEYRYGNHICNLDKKDIRDLVDYEEYIGRDAKYFEVE